MIRASFLIGILTFTLAGCQSIDAFLYNGYSAPDLSQKPLGTYKAVEAALVKESDGVPAIAPKTCFGTVAAANEVTCKAARNQVVAVLSMASETLCREHRQSIYGREATANVALGTLTNLFSGGAAIASTASEKSLYAALALFSNSERSLLNESVYKQMIVTAVDQKIVDSMKAQADSLKQKLTLSTGEFGMQEAIEGVMHIHNSCSFMDGLRLALSEGIKDSPISKIQSLRQTLATINIDIGSACGGTGAGSTQCTQAQARYQAVSSRLKELELSSN